MIINVENWSAFSPLPRPAPPAADPLPVATQPVIVVEIAKPKPPSAEALRVTVRLFASSVVSP